MSKEILFPQSNVVQTTEYLALLEFVMMRAVYDGTVDYFKIYPQIPLIAVTDFSGRRMNSGVIAMPIFFI